MSDEKKPSVDDTKVTVAAVRDMAAEYAEQQEQKRLEFETKQERKRQDFETKLEKQKATREWLMLIITVAAVAAGAWTAYEARQARIEAREAATKALEAQNTTMRLDERPYVKLSFKGVQIMAAQHPFAPAITRALVSKYLLTTYGRTMALDVEVDGKCQSGEVLSVKLPTERKAEIQFPMVAPSDSNDVFCEVDLDNTKNLWSFEHTQTFMYYGAVFYKDMFEPDRKPDRKRLDSKTDQKLDHMTQFCWVIEYDPKSRDKPTIEQCPRIHLEIT